MRVCGRLLAVPGPRLALDGRATRGPRDARAARRCAPRQNADHWGVKVISAVPTAGPWCGERDGRWTTREIEVFPGGRLSQLDARFSDQL